MHSVYTDYVAYNYISQCPQCLHKRHFCIQLLFSSSSKYKIVSWLCQNQDNFQLVEEEVYQKIIKTSTFDISTCVHNDVATCDYKVRRKSIILPVSQFLVVVTNYHVLRISSAVTSLILSASPKLVGGWFALIDQWDGRMNQHGPMRKRIQP